MRRRVSPLEGEPPTGEPCAGDPHARFGGRGSRGNNRLSLPLCSWSDGHHRCALRRRWGSPPRTRHDSLRHGESALKGHAASSLFSGRHLAAGTRQLPPPELTCWGSGFASHAHPPRLRRGSAASRLWCPFRCPFRVDPSGHRLLYGHRRGPAAGIRGLGRVPIRVRAAASSLRSWRSSAATAETPSIARSSRILGHATGSRTRRLARRWQRCPRASATPPAPPSQSRTRFAGGGVDRWRRGHRFRRVQGQAVTVSLHTAASHAGTRPSDSWWRQGVAEETLFQYSYI